MFWNYRVIRMYEKESGTTYHEVFEVYYNEEGNPQAFAESHNVVVDESLEELQETFNAIKEAFDKPVLELVGVTSGNRRLKQKEQTLSTIRRSSALLFVLLCVQQ